MLRISLSLVLIMIVRLTNAADPPRDSDYDYDPPTPGSYTLPIVKAAADGALLDTNGKPVSLRDLTRGRITVLSFIYTRCAAPKACPYATNVLAGIQLASVKDKALARNMRLVSVSFDPEHDTPQHLADYASSGKRDQVRMRMAFRYRKIAGAIGAHPRRLRSGGRQTP